MRLYTTLHLAFAFCLLHIPVLNYAQNYADNYGYNQQYNQQYYSGWNNDYYDNDLYNFANQSYEPSYYDDQWGNASTYYDQYGNIEPMQYNWEYTDRRDHYGEDYLNDIRQERGNNDGNWPRIGSGSARYFSNQQPNVDNAWIPGIYKEPALYTHVGNSFQLSYELPPQELRDVADLVFQSGYFEEIMIELEDLFDLPDYVEIIFTAGKPGPLYYNGIIHISYEFLNHINFLYSQEEDPISVEERAERILDMTEFMLYHELGHALIDLLDIPVLGKPEDAVDHFATILAAEGDLAHIIDTAADYFNLSSSFDDANINASQFWAAHSLDEQRMYSVACLLYGSNPQENRELFDHMGFTKNKGETCQLEYFHARRNWLRLLGSVVKN